MTVIVEQVCECDDERSMDIHIHAARHCEMHLSRAMNLDIKYITIICT